MLALRKRMIVSALIGALSGTFCWYLLKSMHQSAGDFRWAIYLAQHMVQHENPYDTPLEQYPLPAAFVGLPFIRLAPAAAGGLFYGISTALLALGLTRSGYGRLRILLAYPFWAALLTAQWSTLIAASAFFPVLIPACMMKPQVGLPVFLTRLSRTGVLACIVVAALSFVVMPRWLMLWIGQLHNYEHFVPLLVFPGALLLLALIRYRERNAWLLLISAALPQRWFFDTFTLWLIPESRWEIVFTTALSWVPGIWRWYHQPANFTEVGRATVIFIYLPMLIVLLARKRSAQMEPKPE